jgi:eukaryotic-like serine/threonine-protein kinase
MIGKRLGGRYEIEERIGGGGMAIVYKAHDNLLNRTVALKILRSQFGHDEEFIHRFRREAQSAASLSHPNVVNVYDVGEEDDIQYIVMEYVEGCTLKEWICQKGALDPEEAVQIASQICDALEHAHHNHIIHRDIKPHNILIGRGGRIKVTDFGIARAVTSATITHTGSVLGSVHYFSPEQARGGISGEKSDIYSLGIVLYEMLTGKVPFSGDSPISVALKHLQEDIVPPRKLKPSIPQSMENIVLRALVKDPLQRYKSAKEMQRDLMTCLSPERLNEPKLILAQPDEEATRVIPAITPQMMENFSSEDEDEGEDAIGPEKAEHKPRKRWIKPFAWIGGLALFFVLLIYGFNFLASFFYVPEVAMPRVENMQVAQAVKILEDKNFKVIKEERNSEDVAPDTVIKQSPPPGMMVKQNSEVTLYISKGQVQTAMPDLVGLSERHIEVQLSKFPNVEVQRKPSDQYSSGVVMAQDPPAGTMVYPSKVKVVVTVSTGQKTVEMPDLTGLKQDQAQALLAKNGLSGKLKSEPSYFDKGTVFRQYPYQPGSQAPVGSEIELGVSGGYPTDAKVVQEPVLVVLGDQPSAEITILVTDARGKDREAVKKVMTQSDTFNVEVVLSPTQDGTITIYKNGDFLEKRNIRYTDVH